MSDSTHPTNTTPTVATTSFPPAGQIDHPSRPVRRALVRHVQADVAPLAQALVGPEVGSTPPHPVLAALVQAVIADLDHYARRGRLPRRPDLYGFRAYAALAGAADFGEAVLVEQIDSSVGAIVRLWCAGADELAGEFAVDAIDRAQASLCGIARMWVRKVRGQLAAGVALAAATWPGISRECSGLAARRLGYRDG
jgi:hypothetical protein